MPVGAQLLLTLEFWREYRTFFHLGQAWGMHETTVLRTVVRVEDVLLQSGRFSLPGKKILRDAGTVLTALVVDVSEMPCERPKKAAGVVQREKEAPHAETATPDPSAHCADPLCCYRPRGDARSSTLARVEDPYPSGDRTVVLP